MEEEKKIEEYVEWRLNGTESSSTKDLIHLHFYFRNHKKDDLKKHFDPYFTKLDLKINIDDLITEDDSLSFSEDFDFGSSQGIMESREIPSFDHEKAKKR